MPNPKKIVRKPQLDRFEAHMDHARKQTRKVPVYKLTTMEAK